MLQRWQRARAKLWRPPTLDMVYQALTDLDPSSAPGADAFTGAFYKRCKTEFAPVLFDIIQEIHATGKLPVDWIAGMNRCIPKDAGQPVVDNLPPITLLNCKIKWLTGVLKLALDDLVSYVVPLEQKGFVKKRCMDDHLSAVQSVWRGGRVGCPAQY